MLALAAPGLSGSGINRGDLLTIGCAVSFAFHLLVLGYFSQRQAFEAVATGQIAATAALSAFSLAAEPPSAEWSGSVVFALVLTGVFATALAFALQTWGQRYTTVTRTALIFALEPVFALATAVIVGREPLTVHSVAGGALIISGILLVVLIRSGLCTGHTLQPPSRTLLDDHLAGTRRVQTLTRSRKKN